MAEESAGVPHGVTRSIEVGRILGRSFSIWLRNLVPFSALAGLIGLPLAGAARLIVRADQPLYGLLDQALWLVGCGILSGLLTYTISSQLRGNAAPFGTAVRVGLGRLLPVVAVGVLAAACVALGLLACIVPGVFLMCALFVAVPVCVLERPGVLASLRRSFALTRGSRVPIFAIAVVASLIPAVCMFASGVLLVQADFESELLPTLLGLIVSTPGAVMQVVTYHELRRGKEGDGIDALTS